MDNSCNIQLSFYREKKIFQKLFFPKIDRSPSSRFSRFFREFLVFLRAVVGCLASGAATWTVLECNSFEIGFGFLWDCFDLGRITLATKSGSLASCRSGPSFAENFHHENPHPNSLYVTSSFR